MAIWKHRNRGHVDCADWCPSKSGTGDPDKNALPGFVCQAIKPVFETLSSDELLSKCVHGGTQNTNESFHNCIWLRCPKATFVSRDRLELAVADATIVYNDGKLARLAIFKELGLDTTSFLVDGLQKLDHVRVETAYVPGEKSIIKARRGRTADSAAQKTDNAYGARQF